MKNGITALRIFLVLSILTGVIYPWIVTTSSQLQFRDQAEGSLITQGDRIVGSKWIGQTFKQDKYFWSRPSAAQYNPLPSGGTNLSPTSEALKTTVQERRAKLGSGAPNDLLFAPASGLDPHITPDAALYQVDRVAKARHLPPDLVKSIVIKHIEPSTLRILGLPRVNVFLLNMELDQK